MKRNLWIYNKHSDERIKIAIQADDSGKQICSYDYVHIIYVKKGQGIYTDGTNEYNIGIGDLVIIPEDHPFQILQSSKGFIWISITFQNQTIQYRDDSLSCLNKEDEPLFIRSNSVEFQYLAEEMYHEYISNQVNYQDLLYRELLLLLDKIKRALPKSQSTSQKDHMSKAMLIDTVKTLCDKNNTAYVSLNEVAAEFRLTPSYFSSLFKKKIGVNYRDFIKNLRLEKAAFQLLTTNMNIMDITQFCGFSNTKQFYKAFYDKYAITPAKFRKSRQLSEYNSFKTNLSGWLGLPDTWRITENGFETININHHAITVCGMCIDGKKSFSYQIKGNFHGSSIGLLLGVKVFNRDAIVNNTSGLILNNDFKAGFMMINSNVYASRLLSDSFNQDSAVHTLLIQYNSNTHVLIGMINGETVSHIPINIEDISGNLGIIASKAEATIFSAEFIWL